jgi:hypothetical protein
LIDLLRVTINRPTVKFPVVGLPTAVEKLRAPNGEKLQFNGPLDITLDPRSGILYVADFGKQSTFGADGSLSLLRPASHER